MKFVKLAMIGAATVALAACETTQSVPDVVTNRPAPVVRPTIVPMDLENVRWVVRDVQGLRQLADRMEAAGETNVVFYILDQDSYNALAMNLSEVRRYINDQEASIDFLMAAINTNATNPGERRQAQTQPQPEPDRRRGGILGFFGL